MGEAMKRTSVVLDVQEQLALHVKATAERERHAREAKEQLDRGDKKGARASLAKAYECQSVLEQLERDADHQLAKRGPYRE